MRLDGGAPERGRSPQFARSMAMAERILDAATSVAAEHGYVGATTDRIAAAAEVSVGSVYRSFAGKDAIFSALFHRHLQARERLLAERVHCGGAPVLAAAVVEFLVDLHLDGGVGDPRFFRALLWEFPPPACLEAERRRDEDDWVRIVARALQRDPDVAGGDAGAMARMVVTTVDTMVSSHLATVRPTIGRPAFRAALTTMLQRYLVGDVASRAMSVLDGDEEGRAPICPFCGVTALPAEAIPAFLCENPDCDAFGDVVADR